MPEGTQKDPRSLAGLGAGAREVLAGRSAAEEVPSEKSGCGACPSSPGRASIAAAKSGCGGSGPGSGITVAGLSSGDMARGCETTVRTVRFYEEAGLIEPVARSEGGHRMYQPEQLLKLQLIMDLREAGLSLQDIKGLFELKSGCATPEQASTQMLSVLEAQIACMQRKITVLRRLREELASMAATIRECQECETPDFQRACDGCEVMNRPEAPRAMRLLWGSEAGARSGAPARAASSGDGEGGEG